MYLLAPFILQNLKKNSMSRSIVMRMCNFRTQNGSFALNKFFLVQTIIIIFIYLLALFIVQNLKKILTADPELWGCTIFGPKMVHFPKWEFFLKTFFFWKIINIILIYLLAPFIVQNFKKILPADPELWGCAIFGPKMAHFPKWEFFSENLLMSLVSFIHAYLHVKNQSQILIY